jgi:hypothetical protein
VRTLTKFKWLSTGPVAGSFEQGNALFICVQWYLMPASFVVKEGNQPKKGLKI